MLLCPWDFPGKNTAVGCHFLLLGIFPGDAEIQPASPAVPVLQADSTPEPLGKPACMPAFIHSRNTELNMCHMFLLGAEGIATKCTDFPPPVLVECTEPRLGNGQTLT